MSLADDLAEEVRRIFAAAWKTRNGYKVPEPEDVSLANDAVILSGTVLYADLAESTDLVTRYIPTFAAEIYKTYLHCAANVIRSMSGVITAYDGDRIMAVFIGDGKSTYAAIAALKINWCVENIITPKLRAQYPIGNYVLRQAVGIDSGELHVARTGIRGSNDLVWVGRAANYAAKLSAIRDLGYSSWITSEVYADLEERAIIGANPRQNMWDPWIWKAHSVWVYGSSWMWEP